MNRAECLIFLKGEERTEDILSIECDGKPGIYQVRFMNKPYAPYYYKSIDIAIHYPVRLIPSHYHIEYRGKPFVGLTDIYRYEHVGYWYLIRGQDHWFIDDKDLNVSHSALDNKSSADVLSYLKDLSFLNPIEDDEGHKVLSRRYAEIDFVPDDSVLGAYLSGSLVQSEKSLESFVVLFPFGCNKSQKKAVTDALSNKLSVIQGPPGTGKTQTILTIIANLLFQGKTAEIISNNNSAVDNVREKLERYGLSFLLAILGSSDNKKRFISSQTGQYPDMSEWQMAYEEIGAYEKRIGDLSKELDDYFESQETLQLRLAEMASLDLEMRHFREVLEEQSLSYRASDNSCYKINADKLLSLIQEYGLYFTRHDRLSFFRRFIAVFIDKILTWDQSEWDSARMISYLQLRYYESRRKELDDEIGRLQSLIDSFSMNEKQDELSSMSMRLLRAMLYRRLGGKDARPIFSDEDLWKTPESVIQEYPIVTSTAFSSITSLRSVMYDYVIIDESSQCDITTGALSLISARNAVIVGDVKQLQNIVTEEDKASSDAIFEQYSLSEAYRYSNNSLLSSICSIFPVLPSVLLCEHYRCQPRIIGFCNEKFYDNRLVIMTEDKKQDDEIMLFRTAPGYHSREHANLRQAEVIANDVLPLLSDAGSIGIITPYHNNVRIIKETIKRDDIQVATIHSFQGREKDTIIFATSDDIVTEFSDSPMLINVAVSRAKSRFILVTSSDPQPDNSNMHDLISYISYNSFYTIESCINSVFDLLYEQSTKARLRFLSGHRRISDYDSENLMYSLLENIIKETSYKPYGFKLACHYPVRYLFKNISDLSTAEALYLSKSGTHVDFLIYRSIGKEPVVAIEVDGFHFHKSGTKQYERDRMKDSIFAHFSLPLLRFRTNGSGEEAVVRSFLDKYISG